MKIKMPRLKAASLLLANIFVGWVIRHLRVTEIDGIRYKNSALPWALVGIFCAITFRPTFCITAIGVCILWSGCAASADDEALHFREQFRSCVHRNDSFLLFHFFRWGLRLMNRVYLVERVLCCFFVQLSHVHDCV